MYHRTNIEKNLTYKICKLINRSAELIKIKQALELIQWAHWYNKLVNWQEILF